ncbi:MAG: hypothetical protein FD155_3384 [Bacteroidetes bacterium]|nr:MAG: hypothetical protein FD155_3384 [Bacteroidota bacterium]
MKKIPTSKQSKQPSQNKALAAKPKPRSSGTFKPGGELSATVK